MANISYSNKFLDSRLNDLVDLFRDTFKISTKGVFALLLSYGLSNDIGLNSFEYQAKGKEFRSNTDPIPDTAIFVLFTVYLKKQGRVEELGKIITNNDEVEKIMTSLVNIASAAGVCLLEKELSSYKGNTTKRNTGYFIIDALNMIFIPLEMKELF